MLLRAKAGTREDQSLAEGLYPKLLPPLPPRAGEGTSHQKYFLKDTVLGNGSDWEGHEKASRKLGCAISVYLVADYTHR